MGAESDELTPAPAKHGLSNRLLSALAVLTCRVTGRALADLASGPICEAPGGGWACRYDPGRPP